MSFVLLRFICIVIVVSVINRFEESIAHCASNYTYLEVAKSKLVIGNVDGDPQDEIVLAIREGRDGQGRTGVLVYDQLPTGEHKRIGDAPRMEAAHGELSVGNFDEDVQDEIVLTIREGRDGQGRTGVLVYDQLPTGELKWIRDAPRMETAALQLGVGNFDADNHNEIVMTMREKQDGRGRTILSRIPFYSSALFGQRLVRGEYNVLVILWNSHRTDHPAPPKEVIEDLIFGQNRSVRNFFLENSRGKFTVKNAGILGWYDAKHPWELYFRSGAYDPEKLQADDDRRWVDVDGLYGPKGMVRYVDAEGFAGGHSHKWAETIRQAAGEFDFKQYDLNRDGKLSPHELTILFITPQNSAWGKVVRVLSRQLPSEKPMIVDGVQIDEIVEAYIGSPPSLGLVAHELSHILLETGDMYFNFFQPYAAGPYSLMDQSPDDPPHLDPFHKLRVGWLKKTLVSDDGIYTIKDVETHHEALILYDPARGDKEYFIVENRWKNGSYDKSLPDYGMAIWHIIEDPHIFDNLPTPSKVDTTQWKHPDWGGWARKGIRMLRPIYGPPINWELWDGSDLRTGYDLLSQDSNPEHMTLQWADGTPSGFSIISIPPAGPEIKIKITKD